MIVIHYVVLFLVLITVSRADRNCKKLNACSCQYDDNGAIVELRPLGRSDGTPLFLDHLGDDGAFYSYNPCVPFDEGDCHSAAMCKRPSANSTDSLLADQKNVDFSYDGHNVQVTYVSGGLGKIVTISFMCVQDSEPLFIPYGYNNVTRQYHFQVQSKCACENVCYVAPDEGLSTGSILLIIFFVMLFLYLAIGTFNGKVCENSSGWKMLPHYDFWVEFPGFVKDGFVFVVQCACCQPAPRTYDSIK